MAQALNYYYDIMIDGSDPLNNKDIGYLKDVQAVIESMRNLILTEPGQRVMEPEFGMNLKRFLFDFVDDPTAVLIQIEIQHKLERYEPDRIRNVEVQVEPRPDDHTYIVTIYFDISLTAERQKAQVKLTRIR
jgi:phage baseplate assembly protein W